MELLDRQRAAPSHRIFCIGGWVRTVFWFLFSVRLFGSNGRWKRARAVVENRKAAMDSKQSMGGSWMHETEGDRGSEAQRPRGCGFRQELWERAKAFV